MGKYSYNQEVLTNWIKRCCATNSTNGSPTALKFRALGHSHDTIAMRQEWSLGSARVAVPEVIRFAIGLLKGTKTRGRRPDRMAEAYPELQVMFQK